MEIEEEPPCYICGETLRYCECLRCMECGKLFDVDTGLAVINDDGECKDCATAQIETN